ncbi:zonadhesin [Puntigrus tetrazona]|uniref:zonadhesin n=1 Tax=Puntigrus tetrazona TaxID=1606681 RepID=UPI001C8AC2CB|nr:zonadhesin [Puntigrus tetrazona]
MSSAVNREAVFQATKVRKHLKQDGSWINKSQDVHDTESDVKACKPIKLKPTNVSSPESSLASSSTVLCSESAAASSSLDSSTPPQSSNVMSALKKFERLNSTENKPVKSGSSVAKSAHPVLEDSRGAHVQKAVKTSMVKATEQPLQTPADTSVKDVLEKPNTIPAEEALKTHADAPKTDKVKKPTEEPLKMHADTLKLDVVEKPIVKPVEVPLKTHADAPKTDKVEKPTEEPLKMHADTPKLDVVEKPIVKPVEVPLKTHADIPKTDIVEKPVEGPLKMHADAPKSNIVEKPVEEPLKRHAYTPKMYVVDKVKPVEEPLKTPTYVPVKNIVESPAEESVKTHSETPVEGTRKTPVDGASTDQNPAKPSGTLTENKENDTVEHVSMAHAPATESSTRSTTELIEEPRVTALEENHRLNSQAELKVKGKTMCSFCKLPIDGNVKISINIPAICCHPDCFKCNGCSSPLGDLSSSMYHCAGKILCEKCFDQIFQL